MTKLSENPLAWAAVVVLLCAMTFAIRLIGPSDLEGYAQMLNVGYVMDMMWGGHWLVQHNIENVIMAKPPLHTWLIAPFAALFGIDRLSLGLPSFLSIAGTGLLVLHVGRQRFGLLAGGMAALAAVLAGPMMQKQMTLVRTDPLFSLLVAFAAFAAFNAWERGRSWLPFWLAAALATLTKGPLGLLLASGGLLAWFWERRSDPAAVPPRGSHLAGIALFLAINLAWFLPAWYFAGDELTHKLFGEELVGQAVGAHKPPYSLRNAVQPTLYLLIRFLPFSPFVFAALWRVFRHPANDANERRFERFLTCWLLFGLLLFTSVRHQRPDHLLPLWPAATLLAGREIARLRERFGEPLLLSTTAATIVAFFSVFSYGAFHPRGEHGKRIAIEPQIERAAVALAATGIDVGRLQHFDTPVTLQMYLRTNNRWKTAEELERHLAESTGPVDVAFHRAAITTLPFIDRYPDTTRIFRWPADESRRAVIQVYRVARQD